MASASPARPGTTRERNGVEPSAVATHSLRTVFDNIATVTASAASAAPAPSGPAMRHIDKVIASVSVSPTSAAEASTPVVPHSSRTKGMAVSTTWNAAAILSEDHERGTDEQRGQQVTPQGPGDRWVEDRRQDRHTQQQHRAGRQDALRQRAAERRLAPALARKAPCHRRGRDEAAQQSGEAESPGLSDGAARQVAQEVQSRKEQDDHPQRARANAVERPVGTGGEQREDHQRQHRELQRGRYLPLSDATDELLDPRLLHQGEHHDGD